MRLIDADELNKRFESSCTTECACCPYSDDNCGLVHEADTVNAIVIPEGATNGDVIKVMFPNFHTNEMSHTIWVGYDDMSFRKEWWNAPYKELNNEK